MTWYEPLNPNLTSARIMVLADNWWAIALGIAAFLAPAAAMLQCFTRYSYSLPCESVDWRRGGHMLDGCLCVGLRRHAYHARLQAAEA